jgi:hypothetical protein
MGTYIISAIMLQTNILHLGYCKATGEGNNQARGKSANIVNVWSVVYDTNKPRNLTECLQHCYK